MASLAIRAEPPEPAPRARARAERDAAFFVEARPETAYPGSGGNVLVDGVRPTAKADALDAVLDRIPASDVVRIEVLHAGPRGSAALSTTDRLRLRLVPIFGIQLRKTFETP